MIDEYVEPLVLPWRDIFADLKAKGLPAYRVAICIGREWSTVQRWIDGREPKDSDARAVLALHTRRCGSEATARRVAEAKPRV